MFLEFEIGDYRIYAKNLRSSGDDGPIEYVVCKCLSELKRKEIEIGYFQTLEAAKDHVKTMV